MKNTAFKLISVILALSLCLLFSGCTAKSSQQAANATTVESTTKSSEIEFAQTFSEYYGSSYIPEIKNIKYSDANKKSANVIISSYEDYVNAAEIINAHVEKKLPEKDKNFFDSKAVIIHIDTDICLPEFLSHQFKSISVDQNTMAIEENREKNMGGAADAISVHVIAVEVNKSDIQSVENIVVNHHDS